MQESLEVASRRLASTPAAPGTRPIVLSPRAAGLFLDAGAHAWPEGLWLKTFYNIGIAFRLKGYNQTILAGFDGDVFLPPQNLFP